MAKNNTKGKTKPKKEEQSSELAALKAEVKKERGDIVYAGTAAPNVNVIPTGVFLLDYALMGGLPDGRCTTFFGPEDTGKSMMIYKAIASFQQKYPDKTAVLFDLEKMFEPAWAMLLGVDLSRLDMVDARHGQEAADLAPEFMKAWEVGMVIVDSLAAMIPTQLSERSTEDYGVGERAKIVGEMCSKMLLAQVEERLRGHLCTTLFANQVRDNVGGGKYESKTKLPGGWQANFFAQVQVGMKRRSVVKQGHGQEVTSNCHTFNLRKAKGSCIKSGEFEVNLVGNHSYLTPGQVDELEVVATMAKRDGQITGEPKNWTVECWGETFSKLPDIIKRMVDDPEALMALKQQIIMEKRVGRDMAALPPDGYLYGWLELE